MNQITLYINNDTVTMNSTTTGKYAARRVAEALGYDDALQYHLFLWQAKGRPLRIEDDEIMAPYHDYTVARLQEVRPKPGI